MAGNLKRRRQITFDLNQAALEKHYPRPKMSIDPKFYKRAYKDIKRFMLKNGFNWTQYSVYESVDKLSYSELVSLMTNMSRAFPWLHKCLNEISLTDIISRSYNFTDYLREVYELENAHDDLDSFDIADSDQMQGPADFDEAPPKGNKPSLNEMIFNASTKTATQDKGAGEKSLDLFER